MGADTELDKLITDYLLSIERGDPIDPRDLIAQYPQHAQELREFFEADSRLRVANTAPSNAAVSPAVPTRIAEYEILEEVARGGMGVVYKARDTKLGRVVALKTLLAGAFADEGAVQRFRAEAGAAAHLEHDGIVPIYVVERYEGLDYYTMAFVEGDSLAQRLADGPLAPQEAAELIYRVARAVAFAHQRRVLHRDLKPDNILIDTDGQPKITDFGVAKRLDETRCLTGTGEILGTLQFMAPEQAAANHEQVSETADIYSLGAILFAALTGRPVFSSGSQVELLLQVLEQEPRSPRELVPEVPYELEAICLRCLEKNSARRYPSAAELADDLEQYLAGDAPKIATNVGIWTRARRWARRRPLLAAHVGTLLMVEVFRHTKHLLGGWSEDAPQVRPEFSLIFWIWIACCFGFQKLIEHPRWSGVVPYLWSAFDAILVTVCLYLAEGPAGMLLATYALLIVVSGMFRSVRLVFSVTTVCLLALAVLLAWSPDRTPAHYPILLAAILVATSVVVAYHVRRFGYLSSFYERFR